MTKTINDNHKEWTATLDQLPTVAPAIMSQLMQADPFCLFLKAGMGAGKTTLVSHVLKGFGLDPRTPVVSPTYTILNEYQIGGDHFAHLDLYRAGKGFSLLELGVMDYQRYRGLFVEWPEIESGDEELTPTHVLTIDWIAEDTRKLTLMSADL